MPEHVFAGHDLTKTYISGEVEVQALRGIDLDIVAGEVVVLLGPSGSGKSTLLNIMGGLDQATSGRLFLKTTEPKAANHRFVAVCEYSAAHGEAGMYESRAPERLLLARL